MRRIIINSEINAKVLGLMSAHISNIQTRTILITDCIEMLRYGCKINLSTPEGKVLPDVYTTKMDDVVIIVAPNILKCDTAEKLIAYLELIESYATEATLETIETSVVYLGGTVIKNSILKGLTEKTEGTLVNLIFYRETVKLDDELQWQDSEDTEASAEHGKYLTYTAIYDKKDNKKAAALKNPVILIGNNDYCAVKKSEKYNKWKVSGVFRSLAIEVIKLHFSIPEKSINAWLDRDANR